MIIGTVSNLDVGKHFEQLFHDAGIPVTAMAAETGESITGPGSPAELWLEDETLLRDRDVRQIIEDLLNPHAPDPDIDSSPVMPSVAAEHTPGFSWPVGWWLLATAIGLTALPLIGYLFFSFPLVATVLTVLVSVLLVFIVRSMFV